MNNIYVLSDEEKYRSEVALTLELKELTKDTFEENDLSIISLLLLSKVIPTLDNLTETSDTPKAIVLQFVAYLMVDTFFDEFSKIDLKAIENVHAELSKHYGDVTAGKLNYLEKLKANAAKLD